VHVANEKTGAWSYDFGGRRSGVCAFSSLRRMEVASCHGNLARYLAVSCDRTDLIFFIFYHVQSNRIKSEHRTEFAH
jgi:hypothetical protein